MRIPDKVKLFGYEWKVIKSKKFNESSYTWETKTIKISLRYNESFDNFMHEILEAILVYFEYRFYPQREPQELMFIFNHTQMHLIAKEISRFLRENKL
jgi:hypothetical protein